MYMYVSHHSSTHTPGDRGVVNGVAPLTSQGDRTMVKLNIGSAVVAATVEVVEGISKAGKAYKRADITVGKVKVGSLFGRIRSTLTLAGASEETVYTGDLYIQGTTAGLKAGDKHPETGLTVTENVGKDGFTKYLTLEGNISKEITRVFYKSETGTLTLSMLLK